MSNSKEDRPLKILFADDGSQHALAAITLLCDLPLPPGSAVFDLAALTPRDSSNHTRLEAAQAQTQSFLEQKGIPVTAELRLGYPAEVLINFADQYNPDLIVMGAKGLRSTLGILLGGVAQQVVEYASWPVLVVRPPYTGLRRLLFVTDGSPHSLIALDFLAGSPDCPQFPLPAGVELDVLHVLLPLPDPGVMVGAWPGADEVVTPPPIEQPEMEAWLEKEERDGQAILDQALERLHAAGLPANGVLLRGDAATEILEYVKEHKMDLILSGSRGLSQMKGWLLGSVSRKLLHYASCSVLVVKSRPS